MSLSVFTGTTKPVIVYSQLVKENTTLSLEPRRVVETKQQLEKLIMDITSHDLNLQMQQLVADYKKTGDEHYKLDAEYLRSEFDTWWNDEVSLFAPPAEAV